MFNKSLSLVYIGPTGRSDFTFIIFKCVESLEPCHVRFWYNFTLFFSFMWCVASVISFYILFTYLFHLGISCEWSYYLWFWMQIEGFLLLLFILWQLWYITMATKRLRLLFFVKWEQQVIISEAQTLPERWIPIPEELKGMQSRTKEQRKKVKVQTISSIDHNLQRA